MSPATPLTRRALILAAASAVPALALAGQATGADRVRRQRHTVGCCLDGDELPLFADPGEEIRTFFTGNEPIIPRSGDPLFDQALAQTLAKISRVFGVVPGFGYYDDYDGLNAYASPKDRMQRADGTVLFGTRLLRRQRSEREAPEVTVAAICAHEFGHIVQFKRDLRTRLLSGQSTVKRVELHADFLAGYFAGVRKRERPDFPAAVFAVTQHHAGDNQVSSPQHHGTPEERAAAIVTGFKTAKESNQGFDEAVATGLTYAMRA